MSGVICEEEWTDIVNYLYNNADSRLLNTMIRNAALGVADCDDCLMEKSENSNMSGSTSIKLRQSNAGAGCKNRLKDQKEAEMRKYGYLRSNTRLKKEQPKRPLIKFDEFVKCILDFQLKNHEKFLERFVSAFRQVDTNLDGILNPEEFHTVFLAIRFEGSALNQIASEQLEEAEETFSALLNIVDPNSFNRISFSAAASCISRLGGKCTPQKMV